MSFIGKCMVGFTVVAVLTGCGTPTEPVATTAAPSPEFPNSASLIEAPFYAARRTALDAWVYAVNLNRYVAAVDQYRYDVAQMERVAAAEQAAREADAREAEAEYDEPEYAEPAAGTGRCGGDLPSCCIMQRESGGDITAENPTSSASGKWQFIDGTWDNFMGYPTASSAPEWVQDEKARQTWAGGAGRSHWSSTDGSC